MPNLSFRNLTEKSIHYYIVKLSDVLLIETTIFSLFSFISAIISIFLF